MGLFERLGRGVEEFKQTAQRTAAESAAYRCQACGHRLQTDHERCPECGAERVEPVESDEAEDGSGDAADDGETAGSETAGDAKGA